MYFVGSRCWRSHLLLSLICSDLSRQVQHRAQSVQSLLVSWFLYGGFEQSLLSAVRRLPHVWTTQSWRGLERGCPQTGNSLLVRKKGSLVWNSLCQALIHGPFLKIKVSDAVSLCSYWVITSLCVHFSRLWSMRRRDYWDTSTVTFSTGKINLIRYEHTLIDVLEILKYLFLLWNVVNHSQTSFVKCGLKTEKPHFIHTRTSKPYFNIDV